MVSVRTGDRVKSWTWPTVLLAGRFNPRHGNGLPLPGRWSEFRHGTESGRLVSESLQRHDRRPDLLLERAFLGIFRSSIGLVDSPPKAIVFQLVRAGARQEDANTLAAYRPVTAPDGLTAEVNGPDDTNSAVHVPLLPSVLLIVPLNPVGVFVPR